jgi:hypothetical protein
VHRPPFQNFLEFIRIYLAFFRDLLINPGFNNSAGSNKASPGYYVMDLIPKSPEKSGDSEYQGFEAIG